MSTQSGISVSEQLAKAFQEAQSDDSLRALVVLIENEQLVPSTTIPSHKTEAADDFDSIAELIEKNHKDSPAYILVKLDNNNNDNSGASQDCQWCFCTYVPDNANVRSKMLYSSTKATLSRQLGEGKFRYNIHASVPDELSSEGFKRFLQHQTSQAPLTAREREMAEIKQAEGYEAEMQGTSVRRSHTSNNNNASAGGAQVGMPWTGEADKAMKALADGTNSIVQLGIDIKDEKIILLNESKELNSLSLPSNDPSYTFYKHTTGIVFIYCCPDTSPIRGRMIYSSNCQPIVQDAKSRGVQVSKKLETSTPSEVTTEYIDKECTPSREETATPPISAGFARPARPGRRR